MSEENKDLEMSGHSYDGITELDNPLPNWWLGTFFITVLFAFIYYLHYETGAGPTLKQELAVAMKEIENSKGPDEDAMETEETLAATMKDPGILPTGAAVFSAKCAVCHGTELQGQIGPNLTDAYWIHGKGSNKDIVQVIRQGVLDKGMPNWSQLLSKNEVYAVTAFIVSKKNSHPSNPKPPQGNLVE